jgi:MGT family glycosyltransferase
MAKYIFLPVPTDGRVNPTLAVAQELVKRGQEVIYYLPEQYRDAVKTTGAVFHSYKSKVKDLLSTGRKPEGGLPKLMVDESRHVLPQILDRIRAEQADVIVYEPFCIWTRIVASSLKVPAITLCPIYAANEHFNMSTIRAQLPNWGPPTLLAFLPKANEDIAKICESYHVPPFDLFNNFLYTESLTIVFIPKAFQPAAQTFDERYVFVGPSIHPRHKASDFPLDKLGNEQPILYISLGSLYNNQPEFLKMCFEAFRKQPWQVVLSRGRHVDPAVLGPIPDNFLVSPYVPQLEILPRTQVFVTHCGPSSTMESLYYGVPMVAIPQMIEHAIIARRITEMGVGITLEKEAVNATMLRDAVERVASEAAFHKHAQQMQQITREAGGYQHAADVILQFTQEHAGVHSTQGLSQ